MPSNTWSLIATNCPVPSGPGSVVTAFDSEAAGANMYGPFPILSSPSAFMSNTNFNTKLIDLAGKAGSLGYAVLDGLGFSASGLTLTVGKGHAIIDGVIELSADTTCTLQDNQTNRIWLLRGLAGSLPTLVVQITTANLANACFLGTVPIVAGVATSYDFSSVMRWYGIPWRKTADGYKPTDTPGVSWVFMQVSAFATYLWDGTQYLYLAPAGAQQVLASRWQAIAGTVTLVNTDANVQHFTNTSAGSQKVLLPTNSGVDWGMYFLLRNDPLSTQNVLLRNNGDTVTLATLLPGDVHTEYPIDTGGGSAGTPKWRAA